MSLADRILAARKRTGSFWDVMLGASPRDDRRQNDAPGEGRDSPRE